MQAAEERAAASWSRSHEISQNWKLRQGFPEGDEFAWACLAQCDSAGEAFKILNAAKLFANFAAHYRLLNEVRDRVEAFFDRVALNQRAKNPGTQKTCAHSGNGDVERRNQRSRNVFARVVGENRCEQLEVADGNRVE